LTLMDFDVFKFIKSREFLNQAWTKGGKNAPNIVNMIKRFNLVP